jgi:ABC-type nitrate/sulfonate/bicarbonate transport system substrate-binding protein
MRDHRGLSRRSFLATTVAFSAVGPRRPAYAAESLRVQLGWLKNVEAAPNFAAAKKGYFAAKGLDVTMMAGGPQVDSIVQVASGNADVGVATSALGVLAARSRDVPLVVLGCQNQKSALGLAARADRKISLPTQLKGAKIGYQQVNRAWLLALLKANNVAQEDVSLTVVTADPTLLIEGKIDLMTVSVLNVPTTMRQRGVEPVTWLAYDLGVPMQGNMIVCLASTLEKRRTAIEGYLRALGEGAAYNLQNPDDVAEFTTREFGEGLELAQQREYNRAQLEFMTSPGTKAHGLFWIDRTAWERTDAAAVETGVIDKSVDLGPVLRFDVLDAINLPKA